MMRKFLVILLTCVYSVIIFGQNTTKLRPIPSDTLLSFMEKIIDDYKIPGMAISICTSDTVLNKEVVGLRRLGINDSIGLDDKFHIGSNVKAITGCVAARLVEKEVIKWDTKVFDIFPELKDSSKAVYYDVTLNDLLSHRSRVRQFFDEKELLILKNIHGKDRKTRQYNFCKYLFKQPPLEIDSITKFTYSNAGYIVAALMMEEVTGKSWDDLFETEILNPLGIKAYVGWPVSVSSNQPFGHIVLGNDSTSLSPHIPDVNDMYELDEIVAPAGNYSFSLDDYTIFLQKNLEGINGKNNFLNSTTYNYLHYCHLDSATNNSAGYSIGWIAYKTPKQITISTHNGSADTFCCSTILLKELNLGITIITNAANDNALSGINKTMQMIIAHYSN